MLKDKFYDTYEDIEKDVNDGIKVTLSFTNFFVKKIKDGYYIVSKTANNKEIIYKPIRNYLLYSFKSCFETKTKEELIIDQQAKFLTNEIAGKILDKKELEEYLKIRLKEFLSLIND